MKNKIKFSGASLTEFIIVTPIAILFILGIIQSGLIYMAKLTLNNAVFLAARHGANNNANYASIKDSLAKGLIPFYIDAFSQPNANSMAIGYGKSKTALLLPVNQLTIISPDDSMFQQFGINQNSKLYIPNDNLEYRNATPRNSSNGQISIRDANILKIKFVYAYDITKVPLMATIFRRIMCGGFDGNVDAWKDNSITGFGFDPGNCLYYLNGTIPIVTYATVQMQSNPIQN